MRSIKLDYSKTLNFVSREEIEAMEQQVLAAHKTLTEKTGEGSDDLGWLNLPFDYDKEEFVRIKMSAEKIKSDSDGADCYRHRRFISGCESGH